MIGNLSESLPRPTILPPCTVQKSRIRTQDRPRQALAWKLNLPAEEKSAANYRHKSAKDGAQDPVELQQASFSSPCYCPMEQGITWNRKEPAELRTASRWDKQAPEAQSVETAEAKGFPRPKPRQTSKELCKSQKTWVVLL